MKRMSTVLRGTALAMALFAAGGAFAAPAAPAPASAQPPVLAKVGDTVITVDEFNAAFVMAARNKFFHGKPPANEIAILQREVSDQLISRILLVKEAKQRGIKPEAAEIQKTLQGYEQRYGASENWKKNRDKMLASVSARLEEDSILAQLEKSVRVAPAPTEKEVRAYYQANPQKFTEPEQVRVSIILLKVDPSSPTEVWLKADAEAHDVLKKLQAGEDFATLAKKHSKDGSAAQGGDIGYVHDGMLPRGAQEIVSAMKVGEISNPVQLLEGMGLIKLVDRRTPKLSPFEKVESRARDLLARDRSDQAWAKLIADLKKKTPTQLDQSQFLPLAEQSGERTATK